MAKRRTAARKTRHSAGSDHPYRNSHKYASASPSVASSPSPQPQDLVQRRRKGTPVRSPAQGDCSAKGIVFSFRIQTDADLSMAIDIHSYDQQSGEPDDPNAPAPAKSAPALSAAAAALAPATHTAATAPGNTVRVAGNSWSSDPSSFRSSNVMDLSRNLLILHSRKPTVSLPQEPSLENHPYRSFSPRRQSSSSSSSSSLSWSLSRSVPGSPMSSQPSTPPLTDSASSTASSSPAESPSSPTLPFHCPTEADMEGLAKDEERLAMLDALSSSSSSSSMSSSMSSSLRSFPLEKGPLQPARILSVRGLGIKKRTMQVVLV